MATERIHAVKEALTTLGYLSRTEHVDVPVVQPASSLALPPAAAPAIGLAARQVVESPVGPENQPAASDVQMELAVETFQRAYGLPVTGVLDEGTVRLLEQDKCGSEDRPPRAVLRSLSQGEERLALAMRRGLSLRYFLLARSDADRQVDDLRFVEVRRAFNTWSALGVRFQEAAGQNDADIVVRWVRSSASSLNLRGKIIAHADFPDSNQRPLRLEFDDDHTWVTGGGGHDIESVALHEIGHLLGLEHDPEPSSVMHFAFNGPKRMLQTFDIRAFTRLHRF